MYTKETTTQDDLLRVLEIMESLEINYWLDGGWGIDALMGKQTRAHRDIDIDFDAEYTEQVLQTLKAEGYEVVVDWSPVRVELYHPDLGYVDIHPFVLLKDGKAKQADLEGGWYQFEADYFGTTRYLSQDIPCISAKGQVVFHTGYDPREVDEHDMKCFLEAGIITHKEYDTWRGSAC